jgi:hypothetical protein
MKKKKTNQHKTIHASKIKWIRVNRINLEGFEPYKSSLDLSNGVKIQKYLVEFFAVGDQEAFMDLFLVYIHHLGIRKVAKLAKIPERSINDKISAENMFKIMGALSKLLPQRK